MAFWAAFVLLAILAYNRVAWIVALPVTIALAAALQLLQAPELARRAVVTLSLPPPSVLAEVPWRQLAEQFPPTPFSWYGHLLILAGFALTYWSVLKLARKLQRA